MSDIFISYARADHEIAQRLAEALEARGWSVWWDRRLHGGQSFDRVIEEAIMAARSVMVIWSQRSVGSDWVRAEASYGLEEGKLVPVRIDAVPVPLRFRNVHTIDLSGWVEGGQAARLDVLFEDLTFRLGVPPSPQGPVSADTRQRPQDVPPHDKGAEQISRPSVDNLQSSASKPLDLQQADQADAPTFKAAWPVIVPAMVPIVMIILVILIYIYNL